MLSSRKNTPGVVVAGLRGGSGKTIISLGITAAWKHQNIRVSPFKKGPDYIDAGWLTTAAGRPCHNLDTYLCTQDVVQDSYARHSRDAEISVVEGNRGLYDGLDIEGSTSTAELAKLLNLPILLVLDCTKSTRTMAAILMGCIHFDPSIKIGGVILNRVAGKRHEQKIRDNIKHFCDVPVFGVVPKLRAKDFPERHMGLVTSEEHGFSHEAIEAARVIAEKYIDLEALKAHVLAWEGEASWSSCQGQPCSSPKTVPVSAHGESPLTIGVIRDSAFQFYYPDNIAALEALGAKIVYISPLKEDTIPRVHAIYMGGGFPETHAPQLAANRAFRENLRELAQSGLPIYAECGGLIFLGESILLGDQVYPMSGILPIRFGLSKRPQGHGYTQVKVTCDNPFYGKGEILKGHEFRYSQVLDMDDTHGTMAFSMELGKGIMEKKDGLFRYNTLGTYTHIHALGSPSWAPALVAKAEAYRAGRI